MEKEENKDVHTEHCCSRHGCKYGNEDCPVWTLKKEQSFFCESCEWEKESQTPSLYIFPRHRMMAVAHLTGKTFLCYAVKGSGKPSVSTINPADFLDEAVLFGPIPSLCDSRAWDLFPF